jgi:threonine dehydrogenase-like Zn-dependent dehydrogenase
VRERRVDVSALVTHRFPFTQYKRAFTTAIEQQRHGSVKVVVEHPPR